MGTDLVIGESQQVSKVCVVEGLLSSSNWFLSVIHTQQKSDPFEYDWFYWNKGQWVKADLMLLGYAVFGIQLQMSGERACCRYYK